MKKKTRDLTTTEIHMVICIMRGKLPKIVDGDVIFLKMRNIDVNIVKSRDMHNDKRTLKKLKTDVLASLVKINMINLVPPPSGYRYQFIGEWIINWPTLKDHPQYTEIRVQAALGT